MAPMPQLSIKGNTFVLTGRMWTDRNVIHNDIVRKGGRPSKIMRKGYILVMASCQLERGSDNKWHTRDDATQKATAAMKLGALVYHEKMLRDALADPNGVCMATRVSQVPDDTFNAKQLAKQARERNPEWNDEMQARLDANLRETSELLASF